MIMCFWEWVSVLSLVLTAVSLSTAYLFLGVFQKTKADLTETKSQQQPQSCLAAFRVPQWKKCFRLNPVSSWTLWTEWQTDGAKKCEQCQCAQRWFKWAIQRTEAVKIKGLSLIHSVIQHNTLFCSVLTRVIKVFFAIKLIGLAFDTDYIWKINTSFMHM